MRKKLKKTKEETIEVVEPVIEVNEGSTLVNERIESLELGIHHPMETLVGKLNEVIKKLNGD